MKVNIEFNLRTSKADFEKALKEVPEHKGALCFCLIAQTVARRLKVKVLYIGYFILTFKKGKSCYRAELRSKNEIHKDSILNFDMFRKYVPCNFKLKVVRKATNFDTVYHDQP